MRKPLLVLAAAGMFGPSLACASSVSLFLDRTEPPGSPAELVSVTAGDPGEDVTGQIAEAGFAIDFEVSGAVTVDQALDTVFEEPTLSDCEGCLTGSFSSVDSLTFNAPVGQMFDLVEIAVLETIASTLVTHELIPTDAFGNQTGPSTEYFTPLFFDNLVFTGTTMSGATVTHETSSFALEPFTDATGQFVIGATGLSFGPDTGLADLVSLSVTSGSMTSLSRHTDYLLARDDTPSELLPFLEDDCADDGVCFIPGVGALVIDTQIFTGPNFLTSTRIDSFTFATRPIPTPAAGVLAATTLSGLVLVARRRKAGSRAAQGA